MAKTMKLDRNYDGNSDEQNHNRRGHIFLPICLNKGLEIQTLKDEWVSLFDQWIYRRLTGHWLHSE